MVGHGNLTAQEIAMGSALLVQWLGVLLISKGIVTTDDLSAVVSGAQWSVETDRNATSPGTVAVIQEIGQVWANAGRKPQS